MGGRRGRGTGAVAEAVDRGADVEHVEQGIEELMDLAEAAGPVAEPVGLGNFNPEGAEPPPRTVTRRGRPQHLPNFDDERAEQRGREILDPTGTAAAAGPTDDGEREEAPAARYAPRPQPTETEEEPAAEFASDAEELEHLRGLRDRYEANESTREDRLEAALRAIEQQQRSGGAPAGYQAAPAAAPVAGPAGRFASAAANVAADPRAQQVAEALRYQNIVPFKVDENVVQTILAGGPQAAATLDTMLRATAFHVAQTLANTYALDKEYEAANVHQTQNAQQQEATLNQQITEAFWASNADLEGYETEVELFSRALKAENPSIAPADWIRNSSMLARQHLKSRGVNVSLTPGATPRNRPGQRAAGTIGSTQTGSRPRVRPASMDFGGRGTARGGGQRLGAQEQEFMDLARFHGATSH